MWCWHSEEEGWGGVERKEREKQEDEEKRESKTDCEKELGNKFRGSDKLRERQRTWRE